GLRHLRHHHYRCRRLLLVSGDRDAVVRADIEGFAGPFIVNRVLMPIADTQPAGSGAEHAALAAESGWTDRRIAGRVRVSAGDDGRVDRAGVSFANVGGGNFLAGGSRTTPPGAADPA